MNCCEEYAALAEAFLDGELSQDEETRLREHLADCPACQAYLQQLLTMQEHFPTVEEVVLPAGFTARVMEAVRAAETPAPVRAKKRSWRVFAPLAACLALVVVLGSQGLLDFGGNSAPAPMSLQSDSADAEPEAAPVEEMPQVNNELAKAVAPPADVETDLAAPVAEEDGSTVWTMQPPANQSTAQQALPRTADDVGSSDVDSPAVGPAAFGNSPESIVGSAAYTAELRLTKVEATPLLAEYTPLETVEESGVTVICYELTVAQAQELLAQLPEKTLALPADRAGTVLVLVTEE